MEEENSLFLELEGDYRYGKKLGKYIFDLVNDTSFKCKTVNYIADSVYDRHLNTFLCGRMESIV